MKLVEHQGKALLKAAGIQIPKGVVTGGDVAAPADRVIVKAQVVGGKRKKQGLIVEADKNSCAAAVKALLSKTYNKIPVTEVLVEERVDAETEHYLSVVYDTRSRQPAVLFIKQGGIDVEELAEAPTLHPFSVTKGISREAAEKIAGEAADVVVKAVSCFLKNECLELEINPLFKTSSGYVAGDAKVTIDDAAVPRLEQFKDLQEHETWLTDRERAAREVDKIDHRGVAGRTYVELDGDIAVMASGGGASLTAMDTIIQAGAKPANYVEYSGNPTREKVRKLTEVVLSKPGLKGCFVGGGKANFTDIYETLGGFMDVVKELKPSYPIVIRRAGPRDKEAFAMIRKITDELKLNITLYGEETPMSKAAHELVKRAYD